MPVNLEEFSKQNFTRILVISLGGFGDTIMATPLCISLRQRYPAINLTALTMWESSAAVLRQLSVFDKVVAHNFLKAPLKDSLRLTWHFRRKRFDLSILIYPSNRAHYNILSKFINAQYRLGHNYRLGNPIAYCRFLLTNRVQQGQNVHCVMENMKLARVLGIYCDRPQMNIGTLGMDQDAWAEKFLQAKPAPYFGIHPGCSPIKNHTKRRWPADKFAVLASQLIEKTNGTPLIFLGPDDIDLKDTIASVAPHATIVHTSIQRVAALIRRCQLFIASDSSLAHLASACRIPVVSIIGPTNPAYIKPWSVPHRIVSLNLECSPCFEVSHKPLQCANGKDFACVRNIPVSSVINASLSLLEKTQVQSKSNDDKSKDNLTTKQQISSAYDI